MAVNSKYCASHDFESIPSPSLNDLDILVFAIRHCPVPAMGKCTVLLKTHEHMRSAINDKFAIILGNVCAGRDVRPADPVVDAWCQHFSILLAIQDPPSPTNNL